MRNPSLEIKEKRTNGEEQMCLVQYELYYLFSDTNIFSQLIGIVVSTPSHHPIISLRNHGRIRH